MLFRFKGDYTGKRTSITLFGVTFEGREPADVTDADGIRRLTTHPEFEQVTKAAAVPVVVPEALGTAIPVILEEWTEEAISAPKKRGRPRKG